MKTFDEDTLLIRNRYGALVAVRRLCYEERRRFRRLHTLAYARFSQCPFVGVDELYDSDDVFRYALHRSLECFGLDSTDFHVGQVSNLILLRVDEEGKNVPGLLVSLEFPSSDDPQQPLDESVDPDIYELAVTWINSGESLGSVLTAIGSPRLSFRDMVELSSARADMIAEIAKRQEKKRKGDYNPADDMPDHVKDEILENCRRDAAQVRQEMATGVINQRPAPGSMKFGQETELTDEEKFALGLMD